MITHFKLYEGFGMKTLEKELFSFCKLHKPHLKYSTGQNFSIDFPNGWISVERYDKGSSVEIGVSDYYNFYEFVDILDDLDKEKFQREKKWTKYNFTKVGGGIDKYYHCHFWFDYSNINEFIYFLSKIKNSEEFQIKIAQQKFGL